MAEAESAVSKDGGDGKLKEYKEKEKELREAQKEDAPGKKACVGIAALLALAYSALAAVMFKMEWDRAELRKEEWTYACSYSDEDGGDSTRVSEQWLVAMRVAYICFVTLSVGSILTIISAWVVALRTAAAGVIVLG